MVVCDKKVTDVLSLVQPWNFELERTVVICSTRRSVMRLMTFTSTELLEMSVYEALDTDHHGHPLREADKLTASIMRDSPIN